MPGKRRSDQSTAQEGIVATIQSIPTDTVRAVFAGLDVGDLDVVASLVTDDVHLRFGNFKPTDGKVALVAAAQSVRDSIASARHEIHNIWEVAEDTIVTVMDVHYKRLDGGELVLPCCTVLRMRDGLIRDYRIFMDINPVLAP